MKLQTDLLHYRASEGEQARTGDLLRLAPRHGTNALDVGARDGFFSRLLAERYNNVVALDLEAPNFTHKGVKCVAGDVTRIAYPDSCFDFVLCAEVLEHIPTENLPMACHELARVTRKHLLIGVPYRQDLRLDRTTCAECRKVNPPWGHVNSFDERRLLELFPKMLIEEMSFVGETRAVTNGLSAALMNWAGNPFGTYDQDEPCIACGANIRSRNTRSSLQKAATRIAHTLTSMQQRLAQPRANWIHILFHAPQEPQNHLEPPQSKSMRTTIAT